MDELLFRFKRFDVEQPADGFRINTDGVLLGAVAGLEAPCTILDIGTGTGVIALMMAQRFPGATITAIDSDQVSARLAGRNFERSPFHDRLSAVSSTFQDHTSDTGLKFDLIVSNPPFYINSLPSSHGRLAAAKHADIRFFSELLDYLTAYLSPGGLAWLILPADVAGTVSSHASAKGLYPSDWIEVCSFENKTAHRVIFSLGFEKKPVNEDKIVIYSGQREYSPKFRFLLKNFFIIF